MLFVSYWPVFNPGQLVVALPGALSLLYVGLAQADLIPASAWAQYPIVILFIGAFVVMARYHLIEQEKWRQSQRALLEILQQERVEAQKSLETMLHEQRQAQVELLKLMQLSSQEMFSAYSKVQVEAFEEALDKISVNYYSLVRDTSRGQ